MSDKTPTLNYASPLGADLGANRRAVVWHSLAGSAALGVAFALLAAIAAALGTGIVEGLLGRPSLPRDDDGMYRSAAAGFLGLLSGVVVFVVAFVGLAMDGRRVTIRSFTAAAGASQLLGCLLAVGVCLQGAGACLLASAGLVTALVGGALAVGCARSMEK